MTRLHKQLPLELLGKIVEFAQLDAGDKYIPFLPSEFGNRGRRIASVADEHELTLARDAHTRATVTLARHAPDVITWAHGIF